jgi:hypothetical protein
MRPPQVDLSARTPRSVGSSDVESIALEQRQAARENSSMKVRSQVSPLSSVLAVIPLAITLEVHSVVAACAGDGKRINGVIRPENCSVRLAPN